MTSSIVAGRVDDAVKKRADSVLKHKGLTQAQVIRLVWSNIAETGEVPGYSDEREKEESLQKRFRALRAATPRSKHLETMTPEALKEELANRG